VTITYDDVSVAGCGTTEVITRTWTATDACGKSASAVQTITVVDKTAPVLSGIPADITVECDSIPAPASPTVTDNCDADVGIAFSEERTDGSCEDDYTLTRYWTATDSCNNSVQATQTITVRDTTVPELTGIPADMTVECDNVPVPAQPTATDNCDADVEIAFGEVRGDGSCQDGYTLTRYWTATDNCNNSVQATQTITVQDTTPPVLIGVPADVTVECDAIPELVTVTATDNCDGDVDVSFTETRTDGTGDTETITRTWTATDACGNSTSDDQIITVQDTTPPTAVMKNITVELDANGNASITAAEVDNGSSDACGIASLVVSPSSFNCANVGANTVTLTVTDNNGNVSTATATVTVKDNVDPIASAQNITVQLDATGNASIAAGDVDAGSSDACGISSLSVAPNTFDCTNVGANTVTLTVTDNNGNVSTATATVTVEDNVAPVAVAQEITVQLDVSGNASITPADVDNGSSDACGIAALAVSPSSFTCAHVGANTVTLTVTDNNGNVSTATATVTVEDKVAPVAKAQDITIQLDATGNASITPADVNNGSSDACGIAALAVSPSSFTCENVGANTVTLTVTDNNSNVSTATATVIVEDITAPAVTAALVPISGGDDDEGLFKVQFGAEDICDANPIVTAVIKACRRDIRVKNGQKLEIELEDDDCEIEWDDGRLEIEARNAMLVVTAVDASGNKSTAAAVPQFRPVGEDDDEDDDSRRGNRGKRDDDDDDDEDKKKKKNKKKKKRRDRDDD